MVIEMTCPTCGSHDISKNGTTRRGKQNYQCRDGNRQIALSALPTTTLVLSYPGQN
jgi:transposase-like protein